MKTQSTINNMFVAQVTAKQKITKPMLETVSPTDLLNVVSEPLNIVSEPSLEIDRNIDRIETTLYPCNSPPCVVNQKNADQTRAIDTAVSGVNMFLTGPAGSGKSHVIDLIVERMRKMNRRVVVTSTTGSSSQLIGGKTVYSYLSIGIGTEPVEDIVKKIRMRKQKPKYTDIDCLIIDEISMMSGELFGKIEEICRTIRRTSKPFGGLQIILVGDFYQLPFIASDMDQTFCFEHPKFETWFPKKIVLNTIYRLAIPSSVSNQNVWLNILKEARDGDLSDEMYIELEKRKINNCNNEYKSSMAANLQPTRIYPRKMQVETINQKELDAIDAPKITFEPILNIQRASGCVLTPSKIKAKLSADMEKLRQSGKSIVCCVGAQVIVTKNFKDSPLVNGTRGVIVDIISRGENVTAEKIVIIRTKDGRLHTIERQSEPFGIAPNGERDPTWEAMVSIMPLQLAWAVTIHKSQGMTLDLVECDLGNSIFECGQAYVALSRVRDLNSIFIKNLNRSAFRTNEKVVQFYDRFNRLG